MRVIVAARLSVLAEGQTGLDSQEQEAVRWAEQQGHEIVEVVKDHKTGKSHLWDRPNLKPWVTDPMLLAQYDAIVALKVDRLTRADKEGTSRLEQWARDNGKQLLIASADVHFPSEGTDGIAWDLMLRMAHAEWLSISERYTRMYSYKRQVGSFAGRPPWGYRIGPGVNDKGQPIKTLIPTDEARQYVPAIFAKVIAGAGLRAVAAWLDEQGVKPMGVKGKAGLWGETSLSQLVRNPVYSGRRKNAKGGTDLEVEPLVSIDTQVQAKAMLATRAKPGRSTVKRPKALLAKLKCGNLGCTAKRAAIQGVSEAYLAALGPSPMSRIVSGRGKGPSDYYRCAGRGPNRKGCGNMVRLPDLDQLVTNAFEHWHDEPHRDSVYVPGDSNADAIERLRQEMTEALKDADATAIASIAASYGEKIAQLEAQPNRPAHWKHTETGLTVGQHFLSLDLDGRRDYLMKRDIRARREDGRIIVTVEGATARMGGTSSLADDDPGEPAP